MEMKGRGREMAGKEKEGRTGEHRREQKKYG